MLNFEPCYVCDKPINLSLPAFIIVAQCEGCDEVEEMFVFCSEAHRELFVPPSDEDMHET